MPQVTKTNAANIENSRKVRISCDFLAVTIARNPSAQSRLITKPPGEDNNTIIPIG